MSTIAYRLPGNLRALCSRVFPRSYRLHALTARIGRRLYACVGDNVAARALSLGFKPKLVIYDCRSHRRSIPCLSPPKDYKVLTVKNPPSTITLQALNAIRECIRRDNYCCIRVEGEEDLLLLPVVLLAPLESLVAYGQPGLGVVVVECDHYAKKTASKILEAMKPRTLHILGF